MAAFADWGAWLKRGEYLDRAAAADVVLDAPIEFVEAHLSVSFMRVQTVCLRERGASGYFFIRDELTIPLIMPTTVLVLESAGPDSTRFHFSGDPEAGAVMRRAVLAQRGRIVAAFRAASSAAGRQALDQWALNGAPDVAPVSAEPAERPPSPHRPTHKSERYGPREPRWKELVVEFYTKRERGAITSVAAFVAAAQARGYAVSESTFRVWRKQLLTFEEWKRDSEGT
jgi:hypothetical protein